MQTIVGIDPGYDGALVALFGNGGVLIVDTPVIVSKDKKGKVRREYNNYSMFKLLHNLKTDEAQGGVPIVFIEKVGAMPGQGVVSMFNFGMGYGMWLALIAALSYPSERVAPQTWKKVLMKDMANKDDARVVAARLCPDKADAFSRKKDIGRADAFLIAEYGRRSIYGR